MRIGVLGPVWLRHETAEQDLGSPKQRALLAALTLHANRSVPTDTLVDLVWGDRPPVAVTASVHTYVAMLRRALEPNRPARSKPSVLLTSATGYELRIDPDTIDAQRFSALAGRVRRQLGDRVLMAVPAELTASELDGSADELAQALAWWRGSPYADLDENRAAVAAERTRLQDLRLTAVTDRARMQLALGRAGAVAAELGPIAGDHPLREDLWALFALALARAGRQGDALQALRTVRVSLDTELGIDPSPLIRDLEVAVLRQDIDQVTGPTAARQPQAGISSGIETAPAATTARTSIAAPTTAPSGPDRPAAAVGTPFVGRGDQLAALLGLLDEAADGSARSAVLIGEPGMGKTRLAQEFAERAVERGFRVHLGRCSSDEGAPPLWPWSMLLRSLSDDTADDDGADVESADPAGLLEPQELPSDAAAASTPMAHRSDRFSQFDGVARALSAAAGRHPRMLILDDLHWADPSTLRLLRHVTETVDRARLVIVVTRRTHPIPSGALADYGETLARRHALRLELSGLTVDAIGELVTATDIPALDTGAATALRERTGGNPFFVLELLRANRSGDEPNAVPAAIGDVITARVGRLPAGTRAVLSSAATLGRTVDPELLARLDGSSIDDALDAFEPAVDAGLLTVTADGELRFAHDLVREAVESADSPLRRQRRHAAVARALVESDDGSGRQLAELAWHWFRAGPAHTAQTWRAAVAAAGYATGLAAHEEAADLLAAALTAQSSDPAAGPIDRYDLLLARARACRAAADNEGQRAATSEAIEIASLLGDLERLTVAAIAAAEGGLWSNVPEGTQDPVTVQALQTAARDLPGEDSALRCRVFLALSRELFWSLTDTGGDHHPAERVAYAERGFAMARRLADPVLQAAACHTLALALYQPATLDRRLELVQEALACSRATGDPEGEAVGLFWSVVLAGEAGRIAERGVVVRQAQEHVERHGLRMLQVMLGAHQASWLALAGEFDEADALLDDSLRRTIHASFPFFAETVMATRAFVQLWRGHPEVMLDLFSGLEAIGQTDVETVVMLALVRSGRLDTAAQRLDGWPEWPLSTTSFEATFDLSILAEAALLLGRRDLAAAVYPVLRPWAGRIAAAGTGPPLGPVDSFLALAAAAVGEKGLATGHADDAGRLCSEWRMPVVSGWLSDLRDRFGF